MICPNCYSIISKKNKICPKCGFNTLSLTYASNKKAKEKIHSGDGDLVIYTKQIPNDVSKKNLLLLSGLLGLFGAHYFYVGRMWRGLTNLIISIFNLVFFIFYMLNLTGGEVFKYIEYFLGIFFALIFVLTIFDFINICFNKFKIPVFIEEGKK